MQSTTHCTNSKEPTSQLERNKRHIIELEKEKEELTADKEDLLSSISAKKRVIDTLNAKIEDAKKFKAQVLNNNCYLHPYTLNSISEHTRTCKLYSWFHVADFPLISMSSLTFLEKLTNYYRCEPQYFESDESSDEVIIK